MQSEEELTHTYKLLPKRPIAYTTKFGKGTREKLFTTNYFDISFGKQLQTKAYQYSFET